MVAKKKLNKYEKPGLSEIKIGFHLNLFIYLILKI